LVILLLSIPNAFDQVFGFQNPFHSYLTIVIGTGTIFFVGFLGIFIFKGEKK